MGNFQLLITDELRFSDLEPAVQVIFQHYQLAYQFQELDGKDFSKCPLFQQDSEFPHRNDTVFLKIFEQERAISIKINVI